MVQISNYPIGVKGIKWGDAEKKIWLERQRIQRSYLEDVLLKLNDISPDFDMHQYGALSHDPKRYPLQMLISKEFDSAKKNILLTGGVHGYETSGVYGALRLIEGLSDRYKDAFNFVIAPCVSPWGYETINRWNPQAIDPNRSFKQTGQAEEAIFLMQAINALAIDFIAHFDLHETTDTDNSEFRPALAARDAVKLTQWHIPDGFYLVGDSNNPCPGFQKSVIERVAKVTHIAKADQKGQLIGVAISQFGVMNTPVKERGFCAGLTDAQYTTTTEVYPDSQLIDDETCILAQLAAVYGGLDYIIDQHGL